MNDDPLDTDPVYAIRITGPAADDAAQAVSFLSGLAGQAHADAWEDGLTETLRTLSHMPRKHPVAERESRHFGAAVRVLLYERSQSATAYRVYFTIVDNASDPPFVRILHIRHGARRPITRAQAQERLRADAD